MAAVVDAPRPPDRAESDLLREVVHRMRTPLTSIVGFLELLGEGAAGPVTAEQQRVLRTVLRNVAQLTSLVGSLERESPPAPPASGPGPGEPRSGG